MADFGTDATGGVDDRVRIRLGGDEFLVCESWEVHASILQQPAKFSVRLGHGGVVADFIKKYPPRTKFELLIGPVLQQTGFTDGYHVESGVGASEITIFGRDALTPLQKGKIAADQSFTDITHRGLVEAAMKAVGMDPARLATSNEANRQIQLGVKVKQLGPPRSVDQIIADEDQPAVTHRVIQAKFGDRWYHFLRRYLDRNGLFLWGAADGSLILSEPNAKQEPCARILRRRGSDRNDVSVVHASHTNDTSERYSNTVVYGRGGGKKGGRPKAKSLVVDFEMVALGFDAADVLRDTTSQTIEQCEFLASRRMAEARRNGWQLVYTFKGHTTPSLVGGSRCVWTADTVVDVADDEYGIYGPHYVESVTYRRQPETTTTIRLMRPSDLLFGEGEF